MDRCHALQQHSAGGSSHTTAVAVVRQAFRRALRWRVLRRAPHQLDSHLSFATSWAPSATWPLNNLGLILGLHLQLDVVVGVADQQQLGGWWDPRLFGPQRLLWWLHGDGGGMA